SDPNGNSYAIAPISSLLGTNNPEAKSLFTPIIMSPKILGYIYYGQIDSKDNEYNFINQTRRDAIYPAANDTMVATTDVWLRAGPRYWDATKQEYVDTGKVQMIKTGQTVVVGGDTVLASGGVSIWTPISAINPETPAPAPAAQAPKPLRDTPLAPVGAAIAPTFPCTGSLSLVEALICNDPELAKLDVELDRTYRKALNALQDEQKQELISEQRAWITKRAACADKGAIRKCVEGTYGRRLSSLRSRYGSATN
ncbi:MAG: lysozyme inhibitor LprI family protein, partial [Gammaproteobacteria bacterium]